MAAASLFATFAVGCTPPPEDPVDCPNQNEVKNLDEKCRPRTLPVDAGLWATVAGVDDEGGVIVRYGSTPAEACEYQRQAYAPEAVLEPVIPSEDWWMYGCEWTGPGAFPATVTYECNIGFFEDEYIPSEEPLVCEHYLNDVQPWPPAD